MDLEKSAQRRLLFHNWPKPTVPPGHIPTDFDRIAGTIYIVVNVLIFGLLLVVLFWHCYKKYRIRRQMANNATTSSGVFENRFNQPTAPSTATERDRIEPKTPPIRYNATDFDKPPSYDDALKMSKPKI